MIVKKNLLLFFSAIRKNLLYIYTLSMYYTYVHVPYHYFNLNKAFRVSPSYIYPKYFYEISWMKFYNLSFHVVPLTLLQKWPKVMQTWIVLGPVSISCTCMTNILYAYFVTISSYHQIPHHLAFCTSNNTFGITIMTCY